MSVSVLKPTGSAGSRDVSGNIEEEFKDFLEWLNTVPEHAIKTEPIEILYAVYAHERKSGTKALKEA